MITTTIGKIFLKAYNEKFNTNYDAKTFFVEQYYPLFFNQQKYMMTAGNSPLENPKLSWEKMIDGKVPFESPERRKERFDKLIDKIENSEADASIAIGYPSLDLLATTSGQISNMNINTSKEDIYASWIGSGLGVGIQGGISILFDCNQILLDIFDGWKIYREVLNQTPNLKGNQINTWNGQWLAHIYDKYSYSENNPMANFNPYSIKDGFISIDTQSWTKILIAISKKYSTPQIMGYVYNYGQTNTTVGFIPFALTQIIKPIDLYEKLFNIKSINDAEKLYGTAFSFIKACQAGIIGVKALEPKGLKEYIEKGKMPKYNNENEELKINFNVYKTWILAMLNNEDLWIKSSEFANQMQIYTQGGKQGKTGNTRKVDAVLLATNKKNFIEAITEIISEIENKDKITETVHIVNIMPTENVPYFLTLIRFHFAAINNK